MSDKKKGCPTNKTIPDKEIKTNVRHPLSCISVRFIIKNYSLKLRFKQEVSNSLKYLKSEKARLEDEKQEIKNIKDTYYALKYNSPEFLRRKADELEQQKKNQTKERKQGYER